MYVYAAIYVCMYAYVYVGMHAYMHASLCMKLTIYVNSCDKTYLVAWHLTSCFNIDGKNDMYYRDLTCILHSAYFIFLMLATS